jgi:putative copper export protein
MMTPLEQAIILWIHLISASIWVGGSIFIGIVFSPLLKTMFSSVEERIQIMIKVGKRFNKIAVPSLIILMGTGLYNSYILLSKPDLLLATSYGNFLIIKIILVIALIITYVIHVRVIRKDVEDKIMSKQMTSNQIQKLRKKIIILGEITVILSVIILFFATLLDTGV